nr:hypothetical protein [Tanacetum cinerariifolium]
MDQNVDFFGADQIQNPQYPEIYPLSQENPLTNDEFEAFTKANDDKEHEATKDTELSSTKDIQPLSVQEPPQDSDIRQLIEECSIKVCEEQQVKNVMEQPVKRIEKSLQKFRVIHKSSISLNSTSQISSVHAVAPILSTKEPEQLFSMGYKNFNTTPETESDEVIKSGVEELVPILNDCEVTSEDKRECDVLISKDSSISDVCNHSDILSDSNDDDISSDDESFEDIEYVEASIPDPEIVSEEEENDVHQEEEEIDLKEIQDIVLREKLFTINRLIANIESLKDNPTPDRVLNSSISIPISEESDNSLFLPEFETFCDHTEETRSGNTTHANDSLPEYDSFCFEIEPDRERLINLVKNDIFDDSNDPLLEEADLFLAADHSIPPSIENFTDDSEGNIQFLEALLIDDSIPFPNIEPSNFEDNPSVPRPPPEPPDVKLDLEPDSVVMNDKDKDVDYSYLMFVIFAKVFSFLSAESEDTIFDPGISI